MNRQISIRPSAELLLSIEQIGEEFEISDAEVVRQLLSVGLQIYLSGGYAVKAAQNGKSTRATAKKISDKITGRSVGVHFEPTGQRRPRQQRRQG